ncbi:hypothetical protein QJS10_CPA16g00778 [Acorus calamus]|uniref:Uncharacterized protein n=1 Tax=Acorus calamus TaxID=4465 RepID=A0AAV9CZY4_ACOCL|nr:hypothetical protein QJS10_CPA16g00778 [Acorus calamus]
MENTIGSFSSVEMLSPKQLPDRNTKGWRICCQSFPRMEDIICPQPRRAFRPMGVTNGVSSFSCNDARLPMHLQHNGLEMLDEILSQDKIEDDQDNNGDTGYFYGSPPVRLNNPIVNDVQFDMPTRTHTSPLRISTGGKQNASSCRASPKAKIEGFVPGRSDSPGVMPAIA